MKKMSKIVSIILMVMLLITMTTTVMAADKPADKSSGMITPDQITGDSEVEVGGIQTLGNSVVKVLTTAGVVASVIVLVVLGIKYMMGSAEEKAEYKKTLMPYVIGAGLVFTASGIANIVYTFMQNAV